MAVKNSLQPTEPKKKMGITAFLSADAVRRQINDAIGANSQNFISSIISAVSTTPALQECTNASILNAALLGSSLKLPPSPQLGYFYMVPYNDKNQGKVAQFQIGYKGYLQLAIRSGQYRKINVVAIKKGELEYFDPLNEEIRVNLMVNDWDDREEAETIGYYAMFELINGYKKAIYWSKKQMINHADKYSQAFSKNATDGKYPKVSYEDYLAGNYPPKDAWLYSSFWYKNFDDMAMKTMLRQLLSKHGIMSVDLQRAYIADEGVIDEAGNASYVDVEVAETEPIREAETVDAPAANDVSGALFD